MSGEGDLGGECAESAASQACDGGGEVRRDVEWTLVSVALRVV